MTERIRVLQILEATTGGTRRHLADLVDRLDRDRFALTVVCADKRDPGFAVDIQRMRTAGVPVEVLPMVREIRPLQDLRAFLRLCRLLRRTRYDIVHTHSSKAGMLGRAAARVVGGSALIHTPHVFAFEMRVGAGWRGLYRWLERLAAGWTQRLICVCDAERSAALAAGIAPAEKLTVVRNGVDVAQAEPRDGPSATAWRRDLGFEPDALLVGAVGRLTEQKGLCYLVDAMATVHREQPSARAVLVGRGEQRAALVERIRARRLEGVVVVCDAVEPANAALAALDVLALPSLWEGSPYTLIEAMAAGVPAVTASVGGIPEVVRDGENGLLVPAGDAAALAAALLRLLTDADLRRQLGERAKDDIAREHGVEDMVAAIGAIYDEEVARGRSAG